MGSDMKKSWFASARCFTSGAFVNQTLGNQLLHQHADNSAGHLHTARQISARNRLMLTNQIERDVSVYVARCGARGNVEISSVNLSHR